MKIYFSKNPLNIQDREVNFMKRMLYLFAAPFLLLCGCVQSGQSSQPNVGSFSYTDDCVSTTKMIWV